MPETTIHLSSQEREARNRALKASDVMSKREGRLWDEAWAAAKAYYAPEGYIPTLTDRLEGDMP